MSSILTARPRIADAVDVPVVVHRVTPARVLNSE